MVKQRYEYYKGSTAIIDNETDEYVEDVVDVLNQKDFNINELLKTKQLQRKQIADLKSKLAEKDQAIEGLQEINQSLGQTCNNDAKEIERLNNLLKEEKNRNKKLNHEAQKYYEDAYCNGFQNQKAIAELCKLKHNLIYVALDIVDAVSLRKVKEIIDQQIKELKGEK